MEFCDQCGSAMVKPVDTWICRDCEPEKIPDSSGSRGLAPNQRPAKVTNLPTTESGSVRKQDAMKWLSSLEEPTDKEIREAFLAKPTGFSGSTYPISISNVRITGDPKFVETVAGLFKPIQDLEGVNTRVEINLQETEDRDSGEFTGNYALYLSVAEKRITCCIAASVFLFES